MSKILSEITVVILAAGQGRRMQTSIPKVLNKLANTSFLEIILNTLSQLQAEDVRIVVSEDLQNHPEFILLKNKFKFSTYLQKQKLGTADACKNALDETSKPILIINGDTPLIEPKTLEIAIQTFDTKALDILCLGFKSKNPTGYGRLITYGEDLLEIIEGKETKPNSLCNSGIYIVDHTNIKELLDKVSVNSNGEYYITDIVKLATTQGLKASFLTIKEHEAIGINTQRHKARAEQILQNRLRKKALENGVEMPAHETVYLSYDTNFGKEVYIGPYVVIGPNVIIEDNVKILPFSHIEGARLGSKCVIGPYARIRPHTVIGENSKIGNFVEVKETRLGKNTKASHLTYIGDAELGDDVNVGAGTIFCNFDGYSKYQSKVESGVFIGSNSSLVAPLEIKSNAIIGAGSVITENVPAGALSIARTHQVNYNQKAELIRKRKTKK